MSEVTAYKAKTPLGDNILALATLRSVPEDPTSLTASVQFHNSINTNAAIFETLGSFIKGMHDAAMAIGERLGLDEDQVYNAMFPDADDTDDFLADEGEDYE